eukprot:46562-Eustigmatos_ZCMA.PRE.2
MGFFLGGLHPQESSLAEYTVHVRHTPTKSNRGVRPTPSRAETGGDRGPRHSRASEDVRPRAAAERVRAVRCRAEQLHKGSKPVGTERSSCRQGRSAETCVPTGIAYP